MSEEVKYYEDAQSIVDAYYDGRLAENYPTVVEAIKIILEKEKGQCPPQRNDSY